MKKVVLMLAIAIGLASTGYSQTSNGKTQETNVQSTLGAFTVEGITWHALTLKKEKFDSFKKMMSDVMGLKPMYDMDGFVLYAMKNGTMLELYLPEKVPAYKYNGDIAFGFRVSDIEAASKALEKSGYKLLGEIVHLKDMNYSYRHFVGPDGQVYGLNEQK